MGTQEWHISTIRELYLLLMYQIILKFEITTNPETIIYKYDSLRQNLEQRTPPGLSILA